MLHVVIRVLYILVVGLVWLRWLLVYIFSSPSRLISISCHLFFVAIWCFAFFFCSYLQILLHRQAKIIAQPGLWGWTANSWFELPGRFFSWHCVSLTYFLMRDGCGACVFPAFSPSVSILILPYSQVWLLLSKQNTMTEYRCYFDYCLHVVHWHSDCLPV